MVKLAESSKITQCEHKHKAFYAKGQCRSCYQKNRCVGLAYKCIHGTESMYAKGYCKACYFQQYYQRRQDKKKLATFDTSLFRSQEDLVTYLLQTNLASSKPDGLRLTSPGADSAEPSLMSGHPGSSSGPV